MINFIKRALAEARKKKGVQKRTCIPNCNKNSTASKA